MRKLISAFFLATGLLFTVNIANAQQKLGHLNIDEVFAALPEAKTAQSALEAIQKTKQSDLEKMETEFQTKLTAFTEKQKTLSEANKEVVGKELQTMEAELRDLQNRTNEARGRAQQELGAKSTELLNPIQVKIMNAIKAVSKEKGFAYVFDTGNQALVYWDGGEDVTGLVKAKLGIAATAAPKK